MNISHRPALLSIGILLTLLPACFHTQAATPSCEPPQLTVEATLDSLDRLIGYRYRFSQKKEREIQTLKQNLRKQLSPAERFRALGYLVDAYRAFSIDSQTVYVKRQIHLADQVKNRDMQVQARLNMVECLYNAGMYKEADELLKMPHAWKEQTDKLFADKISKEEYDRWRYYYPKFDTTQIWSKVSSQELSGALVKVFKDNSENI